MGVYRAWRPGGGMGSLSAGVEVGGRHVIVVDIVSVTVTCVVTTVDNCGQPVDDNRGCAEAGGGVCVVYCSRVGICVAVEWG